MRGGLVTSVTRNRTTGPYSQSHYATSEGVKAKDTTLLQILLYKLTHYKVHYNLYTIKTIAIKTMLHAE